MTGISVASSAGAELLREGASESAEVKFKEVLSEMPAKELPELSQKYPSKEVLVGADADFFFDVQKRHIMGALDNTTSGHVPYGIKNE